MQVLRHWHGVPKPWRGASIAIGNFDGVHRGHQALLSRAVEMRAQASPAGVMLFEPHPRKYFQPERFIFELTPLARKLKLLELFGLDLAFVIDFDSDFASLSAHDFVNRVLVGGLGAAHVVVGYDFFFGKGREGNAAVLQALGEQVGISVSVIEAVGGAGEIFSSTRVRELLAEGDPRGAANVLGYWWRVIGEVRSGAGRGRNLGFPTANITLADSQPLRHGIYAVRVHRGAKVHHGAAYLGTRPTFDDGPPVLETFLLDFSGDLYGQALEVEFIDYIRDDARFSSAGSLVDQMQIDCANARRILSAVESDDPMLAYPLGRTIASRGLLAAAG